MENITGVTQEQLAVKTWTYSEKNNKHVTHHTITVTKDRFTHEAEVKETSQAMRQRTDLSLKNVNSVSTYYGLSRNMKLFGLLVLAAAILVILAFIQLIEKDGGAAVPIVMILIAATLGVLAYFVYKKVKPSFILELETYVPNSTMKNSVFSYGNATVDFSKKKHSIFFYLLVFPALFSLLASNKSNKYAFVMEPEVGHDIVDTIGPFLLER